MRIGIVGCGFVGSTSAYATVGREGMLATFPPVLTDAEEESLRASAKMISGALEGLGMSSAKPSIGN